MGDMDDDMERYLWSHEDLDEIDLRADIRDERPLAAKLKALLPRGSGDG